MEDTGEDIIKIVGHLSGYQTNGLKPSGLLEALGEFFLRSSLFLFCLLTYAQILEDEEGAEEVSLPVMEVAHRDGRWILGAVFFRLQPLLLSWCLWQEKTGWLTEQLVLCISRFSLSSLITILNASCWIRDKEGAGTPLLPDEKGPFPSLSRLGQQLVAACPFVSCCYCGAGDKR